MTRPCGTGIGWLEWWLLVAATFVLGLVTGIYITNCSWRAECQLRGVAASHIDQHGNSQFVWKVPRKEATDE